MQQRIRLLTTVMACANRALPQLTIAQMAAGIPPAITTPDKIETRIGTLEFKDGAPTAATADAERHEIAAQPFTARRFVKAIR